MPTKEHASIEHAENERTEFREPEAWRGRTPTKPVKVCFAATNLDAWETGAEAVISWRGKRFRIVCEGKDVPLIQTTRGILVGE